MSARRGGGEVARPAPSRNPRPPSPLPPPSPPVTNFSSKDASLLAAATAASAPVGYLCGLPTRTARPAMVAATLVGAVAGFCLAYQRSAGEK